MKKFVSLLMAVALLATMLTVFAVPASARATDDRGTWVVYDPSLDNDPKDTNKYTCIVEQYPDPKRGPAMQYTVATYVLRNGEATRVEVETIFSNSFNGQVNSIDIPQAVREQAAQDYPNLFPTGSTLSEGSWWIIGGIAVIAVAGVVTLVIVKKKKKPAIASGENTDEE